MGKTVEDARPAWGVAGVHPFTNRVAEKVVRGQAKPHLLQVRVTAEMHAALIKASLIQTNAPWAKEPVTVSELVRILLDLGLELLESEDWRAAYDEEAAP